MTPPSFVLTRRFDAPPALVWRTLTEPELVARWYGPGMETEVHLFEPKPGGLWLHEMKGPQSMYQRMEFVEVEPPVKLVMLMSTTNAEWEPIASPMMENWPKTLLTTFHLRPDGDGTLLTLEWVPHEASEAEAATFAAAVEQLGQGWGKGMDAIEEILVEL